MNSKKIYENESYSVRKLEKYLKLHPDLPYDEADKIRERIESEKIASMKFWQGFLTSKIFQLTDYKLKQENRGIGSYEDVEMYYKLYPLEVFTEAVTIIRAAEKKFIKLTHMFKEVR